jgi:hypothetical protein
MSYDIINTILYEKFVKIEGFMKKKDNIVNLILVDVNLCYIKNI